MMTTDKPSAGELADSLLDCAIEQIIKGLFPLGSTRDRSISADRAWDDLRRDLKTQIKIWLPVAGAEVGVREALTLGRDAVMESFDYVSDKADQHIADMRLLSIDAALSSISTPVAERGGGGAK